MKNLAMLISLLLLSGCAANFSTKKYIEGNTFVSESMPAVEIQVSSGFSLADSGDEKRDLITDTGTTQSFGVKVFKARYSNDSDRSVSLYIKTEYTTERRWYFKSADLKRWSGTKIVISEQEINGRRFDTATIQYVSDRGVYLKRVYTALYGQQANLTVQVVKRLDKRMFDSSPYSNEAKELLSDFNTLADNSFTIVK